MSWTDKCTDVAVDLDKGSSYCCMCYQNSKGAVGKDGKKLTPAKRRKKPYCVSGHMGCVQCDKNIYKDCWKKGCDKHEGISKK